MKLLRNYIFWTYERGSFHYDVMVTLILAFMFISPFLIDFKDRPVTNIPLEHSEVLIKSQGESRFVYEIRVQDLPEIHGATSDPDLRSAIRSIVEPIAGHTVTIQKVTPVLDTTGHIVAYDATVLR